MVKNAYAKDGSLSTELKAKALYNLLARSLKNLLRIGPETFRRHVVLPTASACTTEWEGEAFFPYRLIPEVRLLPRFSLLKSSFP